MAIGFATLAVALDQGTRPHFAEGGDLRLQRLASRQKLVQNRGIGRFRELVRQLVEVNEQICEMRLQQQLSAAELDGEVAQELSSLLGRQSVAELDFEALGGGL